MPPPSDINGVAKINLFNGSTYEFLLKYAEAWQLNIVGNEDDSALFMLAKQRSSFFQAFDVIRDGGTLELFRKIQRLTQW